MSVVLENDQAVAQSRGGGGHIRIAYTVPAVSGPPRRVMLVC